VECRWDVAWSDELTGEVNMNKTVNCPSCGEVYNLDLSKYGGKKIKCKKCQAVISVPTASQGQDEFEVVEEGPTGSPPPLPSNLLHRHRMASQRGAVNIALLQRHEASRRDIRQAFLEVHGTEESRTITLDPGLAKIEEQINANRQLLDALKGLLGRALAFHPTIKTSNLTRKRGFFESDASPSDDPDEMLYTEAVRVIGTPARANPLSTVLGMFSFHNPDRQAKIETIKQAIEVLNNTILMQQDEIKADQRKAVASKNEAIQRSRNKLDQAQVNIAQGHIGEASVCLQELLKTAPVEMLGQVLILLSQCTYLSGNPTDAARHIQDAICFGASAPVDMDEGYNDLWAKASSGLPKS